MKKQKGNIFFILLSSSSISVTLNNTSNYDDFNYGEKETKTKFQTKTSTGIAPNIVVKDRNIPMVSSSFGETMRGYIVNSSEFNEGTCYFDVEDPSSISYYKLSAHIFDIRTWQCILRFPNPADGNKYEVDSSNVQNSLS